MAHTARFKDLVAACGQPEIHLSWSAPTKDRVLQRAVAQTRLVTVHQSGRGTKKDFATVGLQPGPLVQYLLFPRSLRRFRDRRIVGIDYDTLGQQVSVTLPTTVPKGQPSPRAKAKAPRQTREADNVVRFEPDERKGAKERPAPTPKPPRAPKPRAWRVEVGDAIKELQAGDRDAALHRLQQLLLAKSAAS